MQSKGNVLTAAQKEWREAVRELGSVISGDPAVIHHPVGATGKHNKVHIGHWWVIPLTDDEHKALHAGETFGHESRKEFEKESYKKVVKQMDDFPYQALGTKFWPTFEVDAAIMDYHR